MIQAAVAKGGRCLFVVNRTQLLNQTVERFASQGIDAGIIQGKNTAGTHKRVLVASIATLHLRPNEMPDDLALLVIDEAHAAGGDTRLHKLIHHVHAKAPRAAIIGLTATPWSAGMAKHYEALEGPLFQSKVCPITAEELIDQGYLCDSASFTVRAMLRDGEPWFVAADVCAALELGNVSAALSRLDDDERTLISIEGIHAGPGNPAVNLINESGLYSLVLGSRKPEAKRFKRWVTGEVLPEIRKTGGYARNTTVALPALPQTFAEALRALADKSEESERQAAALALAAPKVEFVDRYVTADTGAKGFRQVCKLLKANEARFREFLAEERIMYRLNGDLVAYQNHIDAGRFECKTGEANGHAFSRCLFTPKGVEWVAGEWAKRQIRDVDLFACIFLSEKGPPADDFSAKCDCAPHSLSE